MVTTTTRYSPIYVRQVCKYACSCGNKFYRENSTYFTESPFNKLTREENVKKCREEVSTETRTCPKCKSQVEPLIKINREWVKHPKSG